MPAPTITAALDFPPLDDVPTFQTEIGPWGAQWPTLTTEIQAALDYFETGLAALGVEPGDATLSGLEFSSWSSATHAALYAAMGSPATTSGRQIEGFIGANWALHLRGNGGDKFGIMVSDDGAGASPEAALLISDDATIELVGPVTGRLRSAEDLTIADDAAASVTPSRQGGMLAVMCNASTTAPVSGMSAMVYFDVGSGAATVKESTTIGGTVDTTTGALTGTTGTDGRVTVSAHTDGTVYIENRTGVSRTFRVSFLGDG